jgi:hypothetical protein
MKGRKKERKNKTKVAGRTWKNVGGERNIERQDVFHISKLHFIQPRYSIMLDAAAVSPLFKC